MADHDQGNLQTTVYNWERPFSAEADLLDVQLWSTSNVALRETTQIAYTSSSTKAQWFGYLRVLGTSHNLSPGVEGGRAGVRRVLVWNQLTTSDFFPPPRTFKYRTWMKISILLNVNEKKSLNCAPFRQPHSPTGSTTASFETNPWHFRFKSGYPINSCLYNQLDFCWAQCRNTLPPFLGFHSLLYSSGNVTWISAIPSAYFWE